MNTYPIVSIVIPSYNTSKLLKKMVDCIVSQTFHDWELIVVDDGSTDDTLEMMNMFCDPRVITISRGRMPKGGQTCRNIGLEASRGEFVVFFDSDDLISRNCIEYRVQYMKTHPLLDFAVFPAVTFCDESKIDISKPSYGCNKYLDTLTAILTTNYQYTVWTNIYRREALLRESIYWDEKVRVYQDFDFNLTVALASLSFDFASNADVDYYYRVDYNNNTVCSNVLSDDKNESTCYLFVKTLDLLSKRTDYDQRRKELYRFAEKHIERLVVGGSSHLLEEFISVLSRYYKEEKYLVFQQKMQHVCKYSNMHYRKVIYWRYRVFTLKEYKYIKHYVRVLIGR